MEKNSLWGRKTFSQNNFDWYSSDWNMLNMVCVGASSEIQHKRHDLAKANQQQMLLTTELCNRFLFLQPRSAVSHSKFNWNVKASDTNQRVKKKKWRCDTYNCGVILFSLRWYFHWILHLSKLHITITSATSASVWPQEFCIYLDYIINKTCS